MTIEQKINSQFMTAYKEKNMDLKNFLGVLKGEMETQKKNLKVESLTDEESIKILNKFAKGIKENIKLSNDEKFYKELAIVESFLPKELTRDEIEQKVNELISSGASNIGDIMKGFAQLSADKKIVSEIAKSKLQ
jgi:uncharacterized protein YqeY